MSAETITKVVYELATIMRKNRNPRLIKPDDSDMKLIEQLMTQPNGMSYIERAYALSFRKAA